VKYGIDVQEDHLKAGILPNMEGFGIEPSTNQGILNSDVNGLHFRGTIETLKGDWGILFQNLYEAITGKTELLVKPEEVLEQIKIMEQIKRY
jgi:hypothetical protein